MRRLGGWVLGGIRVKKEEAWNWIRVEEEEGGGGCRRRWAGRCLLLGVEEMGVDSVAEEAGRERRPEGLVDSWLLSRFLVR